MRRGRRRAADRPRAARIALARALGVVPALAVGLADRVHRRQVDDVEAERREVGQHRGDAAEAAPRAREQLVPGAEPRPLALDVEAAAPALFAAPCRVAVGEPGAAARHSSTVPSPKSARPSDSSPPRSACPAATLRSCSSSQLAYGSTHAWMRSSQGPSASGVIARLEAVVALRLERRLPPAARPDRPEPDDAPERLVPVPEDRRRDRDRVSEARLDGKAAAVDLRPHVLDLDPWRRHPRQGKQSGDVAHPFRSASTSIRPRCRAAVSAPRRTPSSTGSRPPEHGSGRCCRSIRPIDYGSPYSSASAFAAWPGLLADPDAAVAAVRAPRASSTTTPTGSATGSTSRAATRWPTRCASSASGRLCARYAAERGVRLIGDVPIYVAAGSCDHAAHPELFLPGDFVAGAPPDPLNDRGQKWGNPLYDWDALAREGYRWWIERLRRMLDLVDVFRIDHFRGFAAYWAVPATRRRRATATGRPARAPPSSAPRNASSASCP